VGYEMQLYGIEGRGVRRSIFDNGNNYERDILKRCFKSESSLWHNFVNGKGKLNILFYPSTGDDFSPVINTSQEYYNEHNNSMFDREPFEGNDIEYFEPDLYIFSDFALLADISEDYLPNEIKQIASNYNITINEICEIEPTDKYQYEFNEDYLVFSIGKNAGKAFFFKMEVENRNTNRNERIENKYGIYFIYNNINLIDELFLKHRLPVSHLYWVNDGGMSYSFGKIKHFFLYSIAERMGVRFFYIWKNYIRGHYDFLRITEKDFQREEPEYKLWVIPHEIKKHIPVRFSIELEKVKVLKIRGDGNVILYRII
jgi:hypothetical protein